MCETHKVESLPTLLALSLYFRQTCLISVSRFCQTVSHFHDLAFAIFITWKSYIPWIFFLKCTLWKKGARSQECSVKKIFTVAAHTELSILSSWQILLASCIFCVFLWDMVPDHPRQDLSIRWDNGTALILLIKMLFTGLFIYLIPYETMNLLYLFHFQIISTVLITELIN